MEPYLFFYFLQWVLPITFIVLACFKTRCRLAKAEIAVLLLTLAISAFFFYQEPQSTSFILNSVGMTALVTFLVRTVRQSTLVKAVVILVLYMFALAAIWASTHLFTATTCLGGVKLTENQFTGQCEVYVWSNGGCSSGHPWYMQDGCSDEAQVQMLYDTKKYQDAVDRDPLRNLEPPVL